MRQCSIEKWTRCYKQIEYENKKQRFAVVCLHVFRNAMSYNLNGKIICLRFNMKIMLNMHSTHTQILRMFGRVWNYLNEEENWHWLTCSWHSLAITAKPSLLGFCIRKCTFFEWQSIVVSFFTLSFGWPKHTDLSYDNDRCVTAHLHLNIPTMRLNRNYSNAFAATMTTEREKTTNNFVE